MSDLLGIPEKHVKQAIASIRSKNTCSIDDTVGKEGNRTYAEVIPDDNALNLDQIIDNAKIRKMIVSALGSLNKREEMVLRLRFGIGDINENDTEVYTIN